MWAEYSPLATNTEPLNQIAKGTVDGTSMSLDVPPAHSLLLPPCAGEVNLVIDSTYRKFADVYNVR